MSSSTIQDMFWRRPAIIRGMYHCVCCLSCLPQFPKGHKKEKVGGGGGGGGGGGWGGGGGAMPHPYQLSDLSPYIKWVEPYTASTITTTTRPLVSSNAMTKNMLRTPVEALSCWPVLMEKQHGVTTGANSDSTPFVHPSPAILR